MSRDQKPGKVRVIGGGAAETPKRRATDRDPNAERGSIADRGLPETPDATAAVAKTAGVALLPILLFLLFCAAGGSAFTLFILPTLPR